MKTLFCFRKTWKLAFSTLLCFMLPVILTAQTPDKKESLPKGSLEHPGQSKDSTSTVANLDPVSGLESGSSKESEKKDTSMNEKKESFTQSQDEWLKNAGYFKSNKVSANRKSKRNPEPRQSAEFVNERND